jgi:hypothetical protein
MTQFNTSLCCPSVTAERRRPRILLGSESFSASSDRSPTGPDPHLLSWSPRTKTHAVARRDNALAVGEA